MILWSFFIDVKHELFNNKDSLYPINNYHNTCMIRINRIIIVDTGPHSLNLHPPIKSLY